MFLCHLLFTKGENDDRLHWNVFFFIQVSWHRCLDTMATESLFCLIWTAVASIYICFYVFIAKLGNHIQLMSGDYDENNKKTFLSNLMWTEFESKKKKNEEFFNRLIRATVSYFLIISMFPLLYFEFPFLLSCHLQKSILFILDLYLIFAKHFIQNIFFLWPKSL